MSFIEEFYFGKLFAYINVKRRQKVTQKQKKY